MKLLIILLALLLVTDMFIGTIVCHKTWNGDNTYIPFLGCVDSDLEDWGMEWRNPYEL